MSAPCPLAVMDLGGKCRVPMWWGCGMPAGHCGEPAHGPQLPREVLWQKRGIRDPAFCHGPCCPEHGGPADGEPIVFQGGWTEQGRPMWCAVMPGFRNLQEDAAGFDGDGNRAIAKLRTALAKFQGGAA